MPTGVLSAPPRGKDNEIGQNARLPARHSVHYGPRRSQSICWAPLVPSDRLVAT